MDTTRRRSTHTARAHNVRYYTTTTCGSCTHTRHGIVIVSLRTRVRARYGVTERLIVDNCAYLFDLVLTLDHRICEQLQLLLGCHGSTAIRLSSNNDTAQHLHHHHNNINNSCPALLTAHHPSCCRCRLRIVDTHMHQNFSG